MRKIKLSPWDEWNIIKKEIVDLRAELSAKVSEEGRLARVLLCEIRATDNELSVREFEVMQILKANSVLTNKQIAAKLFVTERTIKFHMSAIYVKYHVRNRQELFARYLGGTRDEGNAEKVSTDVPIDISERAGAA